MVHPKQWGFLPGKNSLMFNSYCLSFAIREWSRDGRPIARIFARGVTWVYDVHACKTRGGCGGMLPQEIFRNQMLWDCFWGHFWDRSGAVAACSVHFMARGVLYPIFGCLCMQLLSHQISTREGTMVDRTAGGVKFWIYLRTYLRATLHRSGENCLRPARSALVLHKLLLFGQWWFLVARG